MDVVYSCLRCGKRYRSDVVIDSTGCPACASTAPANLFPSQSGEGLDVNEAPGYASKALLSLWRYAEHLPVRARDAVSLSEGLTPLLHAKRIGHELGVPSLFIKDEGRNPTWSHKDRFSTVLVSHARAAGTKVIATASSGNAGASLAAYAAASGIACIVSTFASTAGAMVSQTRRYGAEVIPFHAKRDRWLFLSEGAKRYGWLVASPYHAPVVGSHPIGISGYKTLAYEIQEQMGGATPDWCILPVCYGDALIGLWQGFMELAEAGKANKLPRLVAAEVYGSLAQALGTNHDVLADQPMPFDTVAVSIGTPRSTFQALHALRESDGVAVPVGNDALLTMQKRLARQEGIFSELASVAPLVALARLVQDGVVKPHERVVAVATASGLKDLDRSEKYGTSLSPFDSIDDALRHVEHSSSVADYD